MMTRLRLGLACAFVLVGLHLEAADALARQTWQVYGLKREALVCRPTRPPGDAQPVPLVFVFHGHGGSMENAARTFGIHRLWPEAIVVYPQGLPTPGRLTDPEGKKAGWQAAPGDQGDRDLRFFDAMLASLRKEGVVDERRIHVTGHSNGGGFTYLLLAQRGSALASVAPSAAVARADKQGALAKRPVLHVAGRADPLVKFSWQEAMIERLRRERHCGAGRSEGKGVIIYPSAPPGADVATYIHDGSHTFPSAAPALMVDFFKAHPLPAPKVAADAKSPAQGSALSVAK